MQLKSGQQCVRCFAGRYKTVGVYSRGQWHVRYLVCTKCGTRAKQAMPATEVHRRKIAAVKRIGSSHAIDDV
jgi:hypothetical protein